MKGKRVVELGAGTGLCSLAAVLLGAAHVVSTDLACCPDASPERPRPETLLDLIALNRAENARSYTDVEFNDVQNALRLFGDLRDKEREKKTCRRLAESASEMAVEEEESNEKKKWRRWDILPLRWGDEAQALHVLSTLGGREGASAATGVDLVLAAECAYDELCFDDLLRTLQILCPTTGDATAPQARGATEQDSGPEIIMGHYPRLQGGRLEPEIREFERRAKKRGFKLMRRLVKAAHTQVEYELLLLRPQGRQ